MGNNNQLLSRSGELKDIPTRPSVRHRGRNTKKADHFIIKYAQNNKHNDQNIFNAMVSRRRVVFVSLIGLYQTWNQCPSFVLYSSLFIIPLKRRWIYNPSKYSTEIQSDTITQDILKDPMFIELLKWKDTQELVFWMLDDYPQQSDYVLIAPFWYYLSHKLRSLYDPVTGHHYKKLRLESIWWEKQSPHNFKYCLNKRSILSELHFVTMHFKSIQEIVYQSNPNSLFPVTSYENDNTEIKFVNNTDSDISMDDDWWISKEYDPYDIN